MVVEYPAESSVWSFFTQTSRVILAYYGSIIPNVFPQICISVGLSILAIYIETPLGESDVILGYTLVGFLLSFLLVFKTQTAYNQYWTAISHVENCMFLSRCLGMSVCNMFQWEKSDAVRAHAQRIIRLLALHWFTVIEYFACSGPGAITDPKFVNKSRDDIRNLTGPHEFLALYPGDQHDTPGNKSSAPHTNPFLVLFWIHHALCQCCSEGGILNAPSFINMVQSVAQLHKEFCGMNKIDKTQFPLPYAQIVKLLCLFWVFSLPFVLVRACGYLTPVFMALLATGFWGLDEVAEVLESPFMNTENDIDLNMYGQNLLSDLEVVYYARKQQADFLFGPSEDIDFGRLMNTRKRGSTSHTQVSNQCAEFFKSKSMKLDDGMIKLKVVNWMKAPSDEHEAAAVKIQSAHRGRMARVEVARKCQKVKEDEVACNMNVLGPEPPTQKRNFQPDQPEPPAQKRDFRPNPPELPFAVPGGGGDPDGDEGDDGGD